MNLCERCMSSFLVAAIVRQEGATRHRASGWLQLRPSRYSTILPHLSSNNLQDVPPSKLFFSFHSTVPFCSLPTDISCRSGLELSPFWAHIGRLPTRHACRLQERAIFLACLRSRFTTWLWKTESTQRRPKHPDDRRILNQCKSQLVGKCCLRLQNDKQTRAFRSSQEDACQWSTPKSHTAR